MLEEKIKPINLIQHHVTLQGDKWINTLHLDLMLDQHTGSI